MLVFRDVSLDLGLAGSLELDVVQVTFDIREHLSIRWGCVDLSLNVCVYESERKGIHKRWRRHRGGLPLRLSGWPLSLPESIPWCTKVPTPGNTPTSETKDAVSLKRPRRAASLAPALYPRAARALALRPSLRPGRRCGGADAGGDTVRPGPQRKALPAV